MDRHDFIGRAVLEIGSGSGASAASCFATIAWAELDKVVGDEPPASVLAARCLAARLAVEIEDSMAAAGRPLDKVLRPEALADFPTAVNRGLAKAARFASGLNGPASVL